MAIEDTDLKILASERMDDYLADAATGAGGGGFAGAEFVQDAEENNVFPDVMPTDRVTGKLQVRLIYPAVLSLDDDVLSNFSTGIATRPTEDAIEMCVFEASAISEVAAACRNSLDAASFLANWAGTFLTPSAYNGIGLVDASNPNGISNYTGSAGGALGTDIVVGTKIAITNGSGAKPQTWRQVTSVTPGDVGAGALTYDGAPYGPAGTSIRIFKHGTPDFTVGACALTEASLSIDDDEIELDRLEVRVLPVGATLATPGVPSLGTSSGIVPMFRPGAQVLVQHPSTPATREIAVVAVVDYVSNTITLTDGLANAYPTGTKVSSLVNLGSINARLLVAPFSQQTWTRVWQDARIGARITPQYSGIVGLVNAGAEDDRYAIVFKNSTQFDLVSERRGQIAAGNISTDFSPLNPLTNEPLFTLYAAAWGLGWLEGNTLRFDVKAASAGAWVARCTSPNVSSGGDAGSVFLRGDVDA